MGSLATFDDSRSSKTAPPNNVQGFEIRRLSNSKLSLILFFFMYLVEELSRLRISKHLSSDLRQQSLVSQSQASVQSVIAHNSSVVRGQNHSSRAEIHSFLHLVLVGRQKHCRIHRGLHLTSSLLGVLLHSFRQNCFHQRQISLSAVYHSRRIIQLDQTLQNQITEHRLVLGVLRISQLGQLSSSLLHGLSQNLLSGLQQTQTSLVDS